MRHRRHNDALSRPLPFALGAFIAGGAIALACCDWKNGTEASPRTSESASVSRHSFPTASVARELSPTQQQRLRGFMKIEDPIARRMEAQAFAAGLTADELPAVIRWAGAQVPDENAQELVSQLLLRWAESEPAAAAAQAGALRHFVSEENAAALFVLLSLEPSSAAAFAAVMDHCAARTKMLEQAVGAWSAENGAATIAWAKELPEGWAKHAAFAALAKTVTTAEDFQRLAQVAHGLDGQFGQIQAEIAARWAQSDSRAALAWAESLASGPGRQEAVKAAMALWARESPQAAASYLASSGSPDLAASAQIVVAWTRIDPRSAAAWLDAAQPAVQNDAVSRLVASWSQRDPVATANWLMAHPAGTLVDRGLVEFSRDLTAAQPALAFTFADAIEARDLRCQQLERIGREWLAIDPAAALEVIERSDLPSSIKKRLLLDALGSP